MKTFITVSPNRERGYDASVNVQFNKDDCEGNCVFSVNRPNEAAARADAEKWLAANPQKRTRKAKRALSEGELESMDAARNEERSHGID